MVTFYLTLVALVLAAVKGDQCLSGWGSYGGKCYVASYQSLPWAEALAVCHGYGGTLAEPKTSQINNWLKAWFAPRQISSTWIGGHSLFNPGTWQWVGDWSDFGSFSDFGAGEPSDPNRGSCLQIRAGGSSKYEWADGNCADSKIFVCQNDPMPIIVG